MFIRHQSGDVKEIARHLNFDFKRKICFREINLESL